MSGPIEELHADGSYSAYLTPRGECCDCGSQFAADDTFECRGLNFCAECISELVSWLLDGGIVEESDRYDWLFPDGRPDAAS